MLNLIRSLILMSFLNSPFAFGSCPGRPDDIEPNCGGGCGSGYNLSWFTYACVQKGQINMTLYKISNQTRLDIFADNKCNGTIMKSIIAKRLPLDLDSDIINKSGNPNRIEKVPADLEIKAGSMDTYYWCQPTPHTKFCPQPACPPPPPEPTPTPNP